MFDFDGKGNENDQTREHSGQAIVDGSVTHFASQSHRFPEMNLTPPVSSAFANTDVGRSDVRKREWDVRTARPYSAMLSPLWVCQ
jgi:hypothetical protein